MADLSGEQLAAMGAEREALYPRPHNPSSVDMIDVARWDAFEAGWKARAALAAREGPPAHEDMEKRMHEVWSNGAPVPWLRFAAIWRAAIDFAEDRHVERMAPVVAALADAKGAPTPAETEAHHVQTEWEPTDVEIKAAARGWAKRADGSDGNFHPEYVKRAMHQCARAALKAAHKANPDE